MKKMIKHYRYRKVTPKMGKEMKELRAGGMSYQEISKKFGLSKNASIYHLNPIQRRKSIKRAIKSYSKLSKTFSKQKERKRQKYKNSYIKDRYKNDEEFRQRIISSVMRSQKRRRKKEKSTKERILKALEDRGKKKVIKIKVTKEAQEEVNKIRKKLGFKEEPIKPEYELEALFG